MHAGVAVGPVAPGESGWVIEHAKHARPVASDGSFRVTGDTRAYLTNNPLGIMWPDHSYVRFDLNEGTPQNRAQGAGLPAPVLAPLPAEFPQTGILLTQHHH